VVKTKTSFLLKIILEKTHTLQLFTKIIKAEGIYKNREAAKLEGLVGVWDQMVWLKEGGSASTLRGELWLTQW
jgi:hypothetical protein